MRVKLHYFVLTHAHMSSFTTLLRSAYVKLQPFSPVCTRQASLLRTGVLGEAANMGEYFSWLVGLRRLGKRLICPLLVVQMLKKEWVGA